VYRTFWLGADSSGDLGARRSGQLSGDHVLDTDVKGGCRLDHWDADHYAVRVIEFHEATFNALERAVSDSNTLSDFQEGMRLKLISEVAARVDECHLMSLEGDRSACATQYFYNSRSSQYFAAVLARNVGKQVTGKKWKLHNLLSIFPGMDGRIKRKDILNPFAIKTSSYSFFVTRSRPNCKPARCPQSRLNSEFLLALGAVNLKMLMHRYSSAL
jgi:hypothetical protein